MPGHGDTDTNTWDRKTVDQDQELSLSAYQLTMFITGICTLNSVCVCACVCVLG